MRQWAIPILTFAGMTAWWLLPVLSNLSTVISGAGAGDNVTFVWNVWWMRYVLHHSGQTFFFTPFLFYPAGVDLTLHTHTALPALVGAAAPSPIAGQNAVIALHIFLNFLCSYALAHRVTARVLPSLVAAVIFGTSGFVTAHLNGHFNLIAAWTLPLVVLLSSRALERPSWTRGVLVGLALAATAYTDYYLFVYAVVAVVLFATTQSVRLGLKSEFRLPPASVRWRLLVGSLSLVILDGLVIAAIVIHPGDRLDIGSLHMSVRSVRNPITVAWILSTIAAVIIASVRVRIDRTPVTSTPSRYALIAAIGTTAVVMLPLLIHAVEVWRTGNYVSQAYFWRSGPAGIDAATVILGSPFHALWGDSVRSLYDRLHIDVIESSAWIPVSAIALALAAMVFGRVSQSTTPWVLTGIGFLIWALGPWLMWFGRQTPLILPGILVRFVPLVANARIPGRAMVGVYLAVAILAAMGFQRLLSGERTARLGGWCLVFGLLIECVPSRPPLYAPDVPSTYHALKSAQSTGAVCELPLGLRDGFGEVGSLDEAVLLYQTIHERPIVGGFIARLPPALVRTYESMPVIRSLLRLSAGRPVFDRDVTLTREQTTDALKSAGIAFIVLDTRRASAELIEYVRTKIGLRVIGEEEGRVFYEVM